MKQACLPISLSLTRSAVSIRSYHKLSEIWKMVERNAFFQLRCSWFLLFFTVLGLAILFLIPIAGICAWEMGIVSPIVSYLSCVSLMLMVIMSIPTLRFFDLSVLRGLAFPFAGMLYAAMTVSSAINYLSGRREWREGYSKKKQIDY